MMIPLTFYFLSTTNVHMGVSCVRYVDINIVYIDLHHYAMIQNCLSSI